MEVSAWQRAQQVKVWDPFVRCFHWATVVLFAAAFLSPDEKSIHEPLGYALLVLAVARICWGVAGSRHARFGNFVSGPRAVISYLRALGRGQAPRYLGHNPAGGAMVVVLLAMLVLVAGSGWMSETDRWFGVPWVDHLHHISAHLLLILVGVHLLGVLVSSLSHRENLVLAMLTGRKRVRSTGAGEGEREAGAAAITGHHGD
jgi:cytochrome b